MCIRDSNGTVAYRDKTNAKKSADLDDDCVFIAVNDDKTEGMEGDVYKRQAYGGSIKVISEEDGEVDIYIETYETNDELEIQISTGEDLLACQAVSYTHLQL